MVEIKTSRSSYSVRFLPIGEVTKGLEEALVVTDTNVAAAWPEMARSWRSLKVVPAGESSKTVRVFEDVLEWLGEEGLRRNGTVVAWGGGVVGDLAGYAAAAYMRGVRYIQIPTSLLAMVDSSVGGKVGIDLRAGKNLAGAFHPPAEVRIANEFLQTLPQRQFTNGMAEVWKYGFIMDADLVGTLSGTQWRADTAGLQDLIELCVRHKARVVIEDEFETTGLRAILNFGHTVGHAIERMLGYRELLHGEAVAIGMAIEAKVGAKLGVTEPEAVVKVIEGLAGAGLPTDWNGVWDADDVLKAMLVDKKRQGEGLTMSLLERVGRCKLVDNIPLDTVRNLLHA
ncbi:MAG: 3-dehydroquinate synthase [Fimbriimonadaceae bacterium]|nr:3-dehydroquinate synthase [Fimbriimonadaceae bacterium]